MVTAADFRGRGLATAIVTVLSNWALQCGASHAFLQVNDDNATALAVYRKFGFATRYTYHYRARPTECH
jgi:predicted GNAT family acetyltransferase